MIRNEKDCAVDSSYESCVSIYILAKPKVIGPKVNTHSLRIGTNNKYSKLHVVVIIDVKRENSNVVSAAETNVMTGRT